jgi:hypothetical protein
MRRAALGPAELAMFDHFPARQARCQRAYPSIKVSKRRSRLEAIVGPQSVSNAGFRNDMTENSSLALQFPPQIAHRYT